MPVGVDDDEGCVSPGPSVVVAEQADVVDFVFVTGVETVGSRLHEVSISCILCQDGDAVGGAIEIGFGRLFVVAVDKKDRGGLANDSEVRNLFFVNAFDGFGGSLAEVVDAEIIAEAEEEVGLLFSGGLQSSLVEIGHVHLRISLGVGIPLDEEHERLSGGDLGFEGVFFAGFKVGFARFVVLEAIGILGVWSQFVDGYLGGSGWFDRVLTRFLVQS